MRFLLIIVLGLVALSAQAQSSARGATVRAEMLKRADDLRATAARAQDALAARSELEACGHVQRLFENLPQHLIGIMAHMDNFDPRVAQMKNEALELLRETHKLHNTCQNGALSPARAREHLATTLRLLGSHQTLIRTRPTDFNNTYYYHYEF